MKTLFSIVLMLLAVPAASAGIIDFAGQDFTTSPTINNLDGTGLDSVWTGTGGITVGGGTLNAIGGDIGGVSTRFGFDVSGIATIHENDILIRADFTNGTADAGLGVRKTFGHPSLAELTIRSDGTFSDFGSLWTLSGDTLTANPATSLTSFEDGLNWSTNGFVPRVSGASFIEWSRPKALGFGGTLEQDYDLFLISADVTPAAVPEPSTVFALLLGCVGLFSQRRPRRD